MLENNFNYKVKKVTVLGEKIPSRKCTRWMINEEKKGQKIYYRTGHGWKSRRK